MQSDKIKVIKALLGVLKTLVDEIQQLCADEVECSTESCTAAQDVPTSADNLDRAALLDEVYHLLSRAKRPVHKTVIGAYVRQLGFDVDDEDIVKMMSNDPRFGHNRKGAWSIIV